MIDVVPIYHTHLSAVPPYFTVQSIDHMMRINSFINSRINSFIPLVYASKTYPPFAP